jgi:peptidoglycan/xylan/chitin deacetylase (PgdA/CDA1 family)
MSLIRHVKSLAWHGIKAFSALVPSPSSALTPPVDITVFTLHRVLPDAQGELAVTPAQAGQWLRQIAQRYRVLSGDEFLHPPADIKPLALITVDDAFSDAHDHLWPLLQTLRVPVLLFVPTAFIDTGNPPVSFAVDRSQYRPCTWNQLRSMAASPWMSLGAHSHSHLEVQTQGDEDLAADTEQCLRRFAEEGLPRPHLYAYPRGKYTPDAARVLSRFFDAGFAGAPHHGLGGELSRMAWPRVPLRGSDAGFWGRRKIRTGNSQEEYWVERIKGGLK